MISKYSNQLPVIFVARINRHESRSRGGGGCHTQRVIKGHQIVVHGRDLQKKILDFVVMLYLSLKLQLFT